MTLSPRFARQVPVAHPQLRLYCLPYAGGSSAVFSGWGEKLKPEIEVWTAQPRGRGMRYRETPFHSVAEMVDEYFAALRPGLDQPFAFYGHSLGGLLAFEITRRLQAEGLPLPEHLFIGATAPPHMGLIHAEIGHLEDDGFLEALQERYGGIPAAVLQEPELMAIFLPPLRADFVAYERFRHRPMTAKVTVPVTTFAGRDDPGLAAELLGEWDRHTSGLFELRIVPGEHFFLTESSDAVLRHIRQVVDAGTGRAQAAVRQG